MSRKVDVGRFSHYRDGLHLWSIDNFLAAELRHLREVDLIQSPCNHFLDATANMCMSLDSRLLVIHLVYNGRTVRRSIALSIGIKGVDGKAKAQRTEVWDNDKFFRLYTSIPVSVLEEQKESLVPNDRLTICIRLDSTRSYPMYRMFPTPEQVRRTITGDNNCTKENEVHDSDRQEVHDSDRQEAVKEKSVGKFLKDLKKLLISARNSDVTIKVQEKEFPAHKGILQVRSPVFYSMFTHQMLEKETGVVVIDDCEADTFSNFLIYVYTGSVQNLSPDNVCSLYEVAEKYCLEELKVECKEYMKKSLSVDMFFDVLTLSLRHLESDLTDTATEFFCVRTNDILKTEEWQQFLNENTTVGNELMIKAFDSKK